MTTPIGAFLASAFRRNKQAAAGTPSGWVATASGDPATWKPVGFLPKTTTVTGATATIDKTDRTTLVNRAGTVTLTLPASTDDVEEGATFVVKDIATAGTYNITIEPGAGTTFEGGASGVIDYDGGGAVFWLVGTVWRHFRLNSIGDSEATTTTASAGELNLNDGAIAGTAVASKTLALGADKNVDLLAIAALYLGAGAGVLVTATAAIMNRLTDQVQSVATVATPASGTCGVQFTFKNAAVVAVGSKRRMEMWLSDAAGEPVAAGTSFAALVNGSVDTIVAGKVAMVQCSAAGLLGITLTADPATYRLSFRLSNGEIITSGALVVNA